MAIQLDHEEEVQARALAMMLDNFDGSLGDAFRTKCNEMFREYRLFRRMKHEWTQTSAGDPSRDDVIAEKNKQWGADIRVPVSFNIIETIVSIVVAHRPTMLFLPRDPQGDDNVLNVKLMHDAQTQQIDYDLELAGAAKNGFIYGLGIGKSYWRREYRAQRRMKRQWRSLATGTPSYALGDMERVLCFDDPDFESVDPYDAAWDVYGHNARSCKWMGHRLWLSLDDCLTRIQNQQWNTPAAQRLTEEDLRRLGAQDRYDTVWNERMEASGFPTPQIRATVGLDGGERGEQIHEAWEIHTRDRVFVLLDRQVCVADDEAPCPGDLQMEVWRPTPVDGQMVGISEIEPTQHLARELDILRSQRRDGVTLNLASGYAYDSSAIDEADLIFGPAVAIEVRGDPRAALMPLQGKDVSASSFSEEAAVKSDINQTSGLPDALQAQSTEGSGPSTATEAQLVTATVSRRVEHKARRFEAEMIRGSARTFLRLNQRNILKARDVRAPMPADPEDPNVQRWSWFKLGPGELAGEFEVVPEGGSTMAKNVQQDIFQANAALTAFGNNSHVDQRRLLLWVMHKFGFERPEQMLTPGVTPVPPEVFKVLEEAGVSRDLIGWAIGESQKVNPQLPQPAEQPGSPMLEQGAAA
jgi:hypothetical protein